MTEDKETLSSRYGPPSPGLPQIQSTQAGDGQQMAQGEEEEEEDELFKDVDPKTLAAVLLEALNKPQGKTTSAENKNEGEEKAEEVREIQGAEGDRDGNREL